MDGGTLSTMLNKEISIELDTTDLIIIIDRNGWIKFCSTVLKSIFGYQSDNFPYTNFYEWLHPMNADAFRELIKDTELKMNSIETNCKSKHHNGNWLPLNIKVTPLKTESGEVNDFVLFVHNQSTDSIFEEQLKNSLKELIDIKHALDESSIIAITDPRGKIIYVNDKFCEISQYTRDELIGKDHRVINSGFHNKDFFKQLYRTIGTGNVWKGEIQNKAKDGSFYWVHTTIVPFLNDNGKPYQYVSIRTDITDRKKAEEMVMRSKELAIIGELSAGIAHEIRNPLTMLKGYTEFLKDETKEQENLEYFDILLEEIDRIDFIVGEFMALAKPKAAEFMKKNVNTIVKQITLFLKSEAKYNNVSISIEEFPQPLLIQCDENRLKQVFLNIMKNGMESMPKGGHLYVSIKKENNQAVVTIRDEGVGIPAEQLKKLSEPFFSTKKKGNGLGLMVSYKIIDEHQGTVQVESEVDKGTTFIISLPEIN